MDDVIVAGTRERILEHCCQALEKNPTDPLAVGILECLSSEQACPFPDQDLPMDWSRSAPLLERAYRESGQWRKLSENLELQLYRCHVSDRRRQLLAELLDLYENRLNEPTLAFGVMVRSFHEHPEDEDTRKTLTRLAHDQGRYEEQAGMYLDAADSREGSPLARELREQAAAILERELFGQMPPKKRRSISRELIRIYSEHLDQKDLAFLLACRIFRDDFADRQLLNQMESLAREVDALEELSLVYEEVLSGLDRESPAAQNIFAAQARLQASQIPEPEQALARWKAILAKNPADPQALAALAGLHRESGSRTELIAVLKRLVRLETRSDEKIELLYEIAQLTEELPETRQHAVDAYLDILCEDLKETAAAKMLNRLYLSMASEANQAAVA